MPCASAKPSSPHNLVNKSVKHPADNAFSVFAEFTAGFNAFAHTRAETSLPLRKSSREREDFLNETNPPTPSGWGRGKKSLLHFILLAPTPPRRYNDKIFRKAARMLQQVTVRTEDRKTLKPLLKSAIENEKKMVQLGLERTRARLVEFEHTYQMSSTEFERRLIASEIAETVDFSEWRMELGMLKLLERQYRALEDAELD